MTRLERMKLEREKLQRHREHLQSLGFSKPVIAGQVFAQRKTKKDMGYSRFDGHAGAFIPVPPARTAEVEERISPLQKRVVEIRRFQRNIEYIAPFIYGCCYEMPRQEKAPIQRKKYAELMGK